MLALDTEESVSTGINTIFTPCNTVMHKNVSMYVYTYHKHLETILFYLIRITGKHRKHPGGRGNAGGQHHNRINFDK